MEKNLKELFSDSLSSNDFVIFVSIFFSLGFVSNLFCSLTCSNINISNTVFFIGVLGYSLTVWKWFKKIPDIFECNKIVFNFYVILSIVFCFLAYFFPLLFLFSASFVVSLILIADKKINGSNILLKSLFVILTLTFYFLELVPDVNLRFRNKIENM